MIAFRDDVVDPARKVLVPFDRPVEELLDSERIGATVTDRSIGVQLARHLMMIQDARSVAAELSPPAPTVGAPALEPPEFWACQPANRCGNCLMMPPEIVSAITRMWSMYTS
jgi:hypothetical protein